MEKEPWQIAAARYCVLNSEKGFTKEKLKIYINSKYKVSDRQLEQFYDEEILKPAGREHTRNPFDNTKKWMPPLDLVSKITDYDELQEARKSSKNAMRIATGSLIVAIIVGIIQICIEICK